MAISTIRLEEDNSYRHRFILKDDAGDPINLSFGTLSLKVYLKKTRALVKTWIVGTDVELTMFGSAVDGTVDLTLQPNALDPGTYLLEFHYAIGLDVWEEDGPELLILKA